MGAGSLRRSSELSAALSAGRSAFIGVAVFTALLNALYLTGSFFMLQIYDRVLPSRSVPTLIALAVLAAALYGFQAVLDVARNRVLTRVAGGFVEQLDRRVYDLIVKLPLRTGVRLSEPARDLEQVRLFMAGGGPAALFDLPWLPFYLGICYLFHPLIGLTATVGALILVGFTALTEFKLRRPTLEASAMAARRSRLVETSHNNAEVLHAMGMVGRFADLWSANTREHVAAQQRAADVTGGMGGLSRAFRMMLQSAVLAVGAWLVIHNQATAGIIIAGSILSSRALAPIEVVISQWRVFVGARQGWRHLAELLARLPADKPAMALPAPRERLAVEGLAVAPPGTRSIVVQQVGFALAAGQALGVIGPSASGKSSLVRAIVGVWPSVQGEVRLDGARLDQWPGESLGAHVGYLPQDMELFAGTVAQNIARLDPAPPADKVLAAARAAGVHEMILGLPKGYETEMGEGGTLLSAGQRQRIGLARALYGDPFLVVLDEPNANLDLQGDEALTGAIRGVRARGGIVIVVAHRPSALAGVDQILVMEGGRQKAFGPKETVFREALKVAPPAAPQPAPSSAPASWPAAVAGRLAGGRPS
ncbi:MAG: type I secretion system permease/ATPase [Rhodospirillales bacterium]|nr:type I secretion system permease/ATPase [Rhodospirillales bacterium]